MDKIITVSACGMEKRQVLAIGRQMENNYRQIIFDCSGFGVEVASVTLVHLRSQDIAPYIVETSSTDQLTWTVTDTDTAYPGYGKAELRITFTSGLAKSVVFTTMVIQSITADTTIPQPLQSWYDAMIDYIDDHSVSPEQIEQAVADYLEEHPIEVPVTSVNSKTGDVVLNASDVGALPSSTVIPSKTSDLVNDSGYISSYTETDPVFTASPAHGITAQDILDWNAKSDFSGSYNDLTDKPTMVNTFNGQSGAVTYTAPVSSVDGKTGAVTVIPTGGSTGQVLAKASNTSRDVAWVTPSAGGVTSVNGQTGDVTLKTSDLTNDSHFVADANYVHTDNNYTTTEKNKLAGIEAGAEVNKVTSVNGQTGAVTTPNTTYTISISGNVITLTPSTGTAQSITLPVYNGEMHSGGNN